MNVFANVPRPVAWLARLVGWTLSLAIIVVIVVAYGNFRLSHQLRECLLFPSQPRSTNALLSTQQLLACADQKGGLLERVVNYRNRMVLRSLPNVPCPYVGTWTASRAGATYKVTLRDDSQFEAEPAPGTQGNWISGSWGVYKDSMIWLYNGKYWPPDINPIKLGDDDDSFTLVETDGSTTRYALIDRVQSQTCKPVPSRAVAKSPAKAQQAQVAPAAPQQLSGPPPAGNPAELGLWEHTMKMSRRGAPPGPTASVDELGPMAFMLGAALKTVECAEKPFEHLFYPGECKAQIEQGSGQCVIERSRNEGGSVSKEVKTIDGNYKTVLRVDTVFTRVYNFAPDKPAIDDSTVRYQYLGPCKPGMGKGDTFIVKENGEWVTEQQLDQERRQRTLEGQKTRR